MPALIEQATPRYTPLRPPLAKRKADRREYFRKLYRERHEERKAGALATYYRHREEYSRRRAERYRMRKAV